jgi:pimeloyl-ACP methyl ester carboxylesterase
MARSIRQQATATLILLAVFLVVSSFYACGSRDDGRHTLPATKAGDLAAWQLAGATLPPDLLNPVLEGIGLTGVTVSSGVNCYKLTYLTPDVSGTLINASGLVCLPEPRSGGNPVVSYQHGTIFQDRDAPTGFLTSAEALLGAVLAGLGYIAVLPDYIGYGDSTDKLHPYVHAATLASATVDMNRAARIFLAQPGISRTTNGQFFLTGYSEGGYATLATQRLMELNLATEFPVTASEPGAGPYDLSGTVRDMLGRATLPQPAFSGFFVKAYDSIYNAPSQLSHYFAPAFVNIVDTHFDGTFSRSEISTALGGPDVSTSVLFNRTFIDSYLNGGELTLKARIGENDIYTWAPKVPTRLFHGRDDEVVPYANAVTAQTRMTLLSSTTVTVVDCVTITIPPQPTTHNNCVSPFAKDMILYVQTLSGVP